MIIDMTGVTFTNVTLPKNPIIRCAAYHSKEFGDWIFSLDQPMRIIYDGALCFCRDYENATSAEFGMCLEIIDIFHKRFVERGYSSEILNSH